MQEVRLGALTVVANTRDEHWVNKQLREIDEHLFCELQLTFTDEQVWCVVEDTGEQRGPERYVTVFEHRDGAGNPIPYLTDAIVDEFRRRARDGSGNIREASRIAQRRNHERIERLQRESYEAGREIAQDFENHRRIGNFAIVDRSRGLQQARARARSTRAEQLRAMQDAARIARELARRRGRARLVDA